MKRPPLQGQETSLRASPKPYILAADTPPLLQIAPGPDTVQWYKANLCWQTIVDPRGLRVIFLDTDFVHLIKMTDKFGKEPRNRRMTIEQIASGRVALTPGRFDVRRTQELSWARSIVEAPTMIVRNWQIMGRANPGDAYIKDFGAPGCRPVYRVLICGHEGLKRRAVTIFPRERFSELELQPVLWP